MAVMRQVAQTKADLGYYISAKASQQPNGLGLADKAPKYFKYNFKSISYRAIPAWRQGL